MALKCSSVTAGGSHCRGPLRTVLLDLTIKSTMQGVGGPLSYRKPYTQSDPAGWQDPEMFRCSLFLIKNRSGANLAGTGFEVILWNLQG